MGAMSRRNSMRRGGAATAGPFFAGGGAFFTWAGGGVACPMPASATGQSRSKMSGPLLNRIRKVLPWACFLPAEHHSSSQLDAIAQGTVATFLILPSKKSSPDTNLDYNVGFT